MRSEIERKFLLDGLPERLAGQAGERISQGYLTGGSGEVEVRLRRAGERLLLGVKSGEGEVRGEVEIAVYSELFERLWPLTENRRLIKVRRLLTLGEDLEAEVDAYEGDLSGLVVAEVEFGDEAQAKGFRPPAWLGEEVTGDSRYANRRLVESGVPARRSKQSGPSQAYRLKRKEKVGGGLRRIAAGRAAKVLDGLAEVDGDDLAEAIHSARKDIKKLRAVLRLVRDELGEDLFAAENERYRGAGRLLSGSRDAEVKLETLAGLESRFGEEVPSASASGWRQLLEHERDEVAGAPEGGTAAPIGAVRETVAAGRERIADWPLSGNSWDLLGPGLRASYGKGRKAMGAVLDDPDPARVHEWRKRCKDLWYQLRLIRKAWPELLGEAVDQTHALADLLGDHHDLTVLGEDLAGRPAEVGSRKALGALIERRQDELLGEALELGARLYAEKPKAFSKRVEAYWSAWRP